MRVDKQAPSIANAAWVWALILGCGLGIAAAPWVLPLFAKQPTANVSENDADANDNATSTPQPPPPNPATTADYRHLAVDFEPEHWARLEDHRNRSLAAGGITRDDNAIVPVVVRANGQSAEGTARLKGDLTDHIMSDMWSLRFELKTPLLGMRRFSIQHPATRGFIMEWWVMRVARSMGLLTPRCEFVMSSVNNREARLYYLEEHPTKEMLESQGRRDGPVVKFDESGKWSIWHQFDQLSNGYLPPAMERTAFVMDAPAVAFGEGRLQRVSALNTRLNRAIDQMRAMRRLASEADLPEDRIRRTLESQLLDGQVVEDLFDTEKVGKWLALHTMFRGFHGLIWHQLRFYHDPITDRLEPMVFDTGSTFIARDDLLAIDSVFARWYRTSPRVMQAAFEELRRMTAPGWAEQVLEDALPRIRQLAETTRKEPSEMPKEQVESFVDLLFEKQARMLLEYRDFVRKMLSPDAAATFTATTYTIADAAGGEPIPIIDVEAWSRTTIPVTVDQFVFGNGKQLAAAPLLVGLAGVEDSLDERARLPDGRVLLPTSGAPMRFLFRADQRLLGLNQVQAIKQAIRQGTKTASKKLPKIDVRYHVGVITEPREFRLMMRRDHAERRPAVGRPPSPTLLAAIERHAFLHYDVQTDRLSIPAGTHQVDGDLLLPDNHALHIEPGAHLQLDGDAVMVVGALQAIGTADEPIRISSPGDDRPFAGVLVLGTAGPSHCVHLQVRGGKQIARDAWQTTGAVNFVGSDVRLVDCTFANAQGEDSLNIVRVRVHVENCAFLGGASDLFDGDFIDGVVKGCRFADSVEDALDVSGSNLDVQNCVFDRIGDKALSVGEGSTVKANTCHVKGAMIAASSKDRSQVDIDGLIVDQVERFVAVAYIKKPEFGPAGLRIQGLQWNGSGEPVYLAQTGCELVVDDQAVATQDLDVKALYRDKILGK